ncbi:hypothetical protein IP91_04709 [Pseudoduganella lurida]|uniref:Uncharacterized protein n=1 Tax=Pseudoduganella lurida TaxID=1036180 RepID=A0A562QWG2_9BURK|nr:hypothetical protein [Pseudoduganella lurida]TWI61122.1 hypothetical protein IP91_04709 [Pseudoduganella lurida]
MSGPVMSPLPHEPRIDDAPRQQALTERYLLPALAPLKALFAGLRAVLPPQLLAAGDSRAITQAVSRGLHDAGPTALPEAERAGHDAIAAFLGAGGSARHIWGALRGERLHDGFLFGTLFIDVAQPGGVAIVPFRQAGLTPVQDHRHYGLLLARSRGAHIFPNHVLPALAPYAPLLLLVPGGGVSLASHESYMLALAHARGFTSSALVLERPALDEGLFRLVAGKLSAAGIAVPADAAAGRAAALDACRRYRDTRRRAGDAFEQKALAAIDRANAQLCTLAVSAS